MNLIITIEAGPTGAGSRVLDHHRVNAGSSWQPVAAAITDAIREAIREATDSEQCDGCADWFPNGAWVEADERTILCLQCAEERETANRERRMPRAGGG